jgi:hypothetical protein
MHNSADDGGLNMRLAAMIMAAAATQLSPIALAQIPTGSSASAVDMAPEAKL